MTGTAESVHSGRVSRMASRADGKPNVRAMVHLQAVSLGLVSRYGAHALKPEPVVATGLDDGRSHERHRSKSPVSGSQRRLSTESLHLNDRICSPLRAPASRSRLWRVSGQVSRRGAEGEICSATVIPAEIRSLAKTALGRRGDGRCGGPDGASPTPTTLGPFGVAVQPFFWAPVEPKPLQRVSEQVSQGWVRGGDCSPTRSGR